MNTRSPKDVPLYDFDNPRVQQQIAHEFDSLGAKLGNDDNEEVWAFIRATIKMTRVNSGAEAVDLLRRSTRIREDLGKILRFGERHFSARVTVREWSEEVAERPQFEFRGFVHKKQLNAVTQYFHPNYSPELHARRDEIAAKIKEFHDSIRDKIPHQSYVIDFYVTRDDHVLIVELNPFVSHYLIWHRHSQHVTARRRGCRAVHVARAQRAVHERAVHLPLRDECIGGRRWAVSLARVLFTEC